MRKDRISKEALERVAKVYSHQSTDYMKGTVMEPTVNLGLRPSFSEYETLGKTHESLTKRIDSLNEKMKISRQRGAFQALQDQMREIKKLVKEREGIDAKMAVIDLARKKTDDHKFATNQELSYSERLDSVSAKLDYIESLLGAAGEFK